MYLEDFLITCRHGVVASDDQTDAARNENTACESVFPYLFNCLSCRDILLAEWKLSRKLGMLFEFKIAYLDKYCENYCVDKSIMFLHKSFYI